MAQRRQNGGPPAPATGGGGAFDERAALVVRALGLWTWDWDLATGTLWFNDGWETALGHAPGELPAEIELFDRLIHPDDRAGALAAVKACLKGESPDFRHEHRLRAKDGGWRWFADRGRVVARDAAGAPLRMVGARDDISARKHAEQQLAEDAIHRRLFVSSNTAFWTREPDGTLVFADAGVAALFGLPQQLTPRSTPIDAIHPDDRAAVRSGWAAAEATRTPLDLEHRVRMPHGGYEWVQARAYPMLDADGRVERWYGSSNIVHDRKLAELRLHEHEDHLRSILETAPDAIVVMDEEGLITSFNPTAETMFGYAAAEVTGERLSRLMDDDMAAAHERGLAHYLRTGKARVLGRRCTLEARRKDGEIFPVELFIGEARQGDRRVFSGFLRDLNERRRIEARMRELQDELAYTGRTQAMVAMSAAIAHELNQPLAAAANYLAVLRLTVRGGRRIDEGVITAAIDQVLRAGQVLKSLRGFIARGELDRKPEPLRPIIEDALALALVGPHRCVASAVELADDVDRVIVDRVQIQQVLFNLLRNAAEALAGHAAPRVVIRARRAPGSTALIEIVDNGPGLPPRRRESLFEPLSSSKPEGMGIGLSIARSIIEAHDGRIWADCPAEGGTIFSLSLPTPARRRRAA